MSFADDTPNIVATYDGDTGDTRTIAFAVFDDRVDPLIAGEAPELWDFLETVANENNNPPPEWPVGLPIPTWTLRSVVRA